METYLNFLLLVVSICTRSVASFELDPTWPDTAVKEMKVYGTGIVLNSEGNLIVIHRSGIMQPGAPVNQTIQEDVVLVVDSVTGKILQTWGKNLFHWPHGIAFKYDPITKVWNDSAILTIGERFISGSDTTHFCTPSDIALVPGSGDFYVADGYCNSRIVTFDKNGNYLFEFSAGSADTPNPIPFNITHSVALAPSSNSTEYLVFVADRDNSRVQVFNPTGSFLYELNSQQFGAAGMPMMFAVTHAPHAGDKFGRIYVTYGLNQNANFAEVDIINGENSKVGKSYAIVPDGEIGDWYEAAHDIAVAKDGNTVFVAVSRADRLILRKYKRNMGGGSGRRMGGSVLILLLTFVLVKWN
ncbi:Peptidyl-glycine alpha-amidating monooxygenase A [Folsomia candida]|uniref:Peptidyl-glycine alpha-amidating monooxygenase A n=1 Tax=Folsomia candida TaxID=158441 RepID=A0A226E9Q9_FOLCA|nr:Peptidyl-glycine alpha-amidating monooxygenase A [Folsomia candida]